MGGFLLGVSCQNAEAFLPIPPTPLSPVIGPATNVLKLLSQGQEFYHQIQSGLTLDGAMGLLGAKGGMLGGVWDQIKEVSPLGSDKKGEAKTPGQNKVSTSTTLDIDSNTVDEKAFFNAFFTLFFNHSFESDVKEQIIHEAYRNKAVEYKQDIAINTYIAARAMEDYLSTVEETLNRLEECQNGNYSEKECVFFGMKMAEVSAEEQQAQTTEEGEEDNTAQIGAARNAYIVTMVYDRLLRIIEDLTATEALFQSSKQIDLAEPVKESNAERYINRSYQFAYSDSHTYTSAKSILKFKKRAENCSNGTGKNCAKINKDKVKMKSVNETEILALFKPIEDYIDKAVAVHNLKSSLPEYKSQYRQYLLQKEIHENAKKLVKASDNCVIDLLKRHNENKDITAEEIWYGKSWISDEERFDYANRIGQASKLLNKYDRVSTNIVLGTSDGCEDYYETCPAGYTKTTDCCESDSHKCACSIELITEDQTEGQEVTNITNVNSSEFSKRYENASETDGFLNSDNAAEVQTEGRKTAELTWGLGRDMISEMMRKYNLNFKPWNDQKLLQTEYLRNKYRNIRLIIKSTDKGSTAYEVAKTYTSSNETDPVKPYIEAALRCKSIDEAIANAKTKYCTAEYYSCDVKNSNGYIIIKRKKSYYDDEGNLKVYSVSDVTEDQRVSLNNTCTYKKEAGHVDTSSICLTPACLVNKYFQTAWKDADEFYTYGKNNGREVAIDKLRNVINERASQDEKIKKSIREYQTKKEKYENDIARAITNLNTTNTKLDKAQKNKNTVAEEIRKTEQRIKSIESELAILDSRNKGTKYVDDKCLIERQIGELKNEKSCLTTGTMSKPYSCNSCQKLPKSKRINCKTIKLDCGKYGVQLREDYRTGLLNITPTSREGRYIFMPTAEVEKAKYEKVVKSEKSKLDELKARIDKLKEDSTKLTEDFAEKYLDLEEEAQSAIESKNSEFEGFLEKATGEDQAYRMLDWNEKDCYKKVLGICVNKKKPKRRDEDNLEATLTYIVAKKGNLEDALKSELDRVFFSPSSKIKNVLISAGIPNNFYVDSTFSAINIAAGSLSAENLAKAVKNAVIETAVIELGNNVKKADEKVESAINDAVKTIEDFTKKHRVNGEGTLAPDTAYLEKPSIDHEELLTTLREISQSVVEGENLFGIPDEEQFMKMLNIKEDQEDENIIDTAYFVGLPARGINYREKATSDTNAGRDFIAPKDMLASEPPVREIFYFNATDFDDVAKFKNKKKKTTSPVISELLNCKYFSIDKKTCEVEYLPEIWRHLLARPNLRNDGKYQQTFIEKSFGKNQLNNLVRNLLASSGVTNPNDKNYRTIIGRGGVYPCRIGSKVVDMGYSKDKDEAKYLQFKTRKKLPLGKTLQSLPTCQEVKFEGKSIYHLLADHGLKDVKDTETPADIDGEDLYEKYSELGQFLMQDMAYRTIHQSLHEYLLDTKNTDNDITRQKVEIASFKRNTLGSFLEAITTEYNARKNLKSSEETIKKTMESLCAQLKENGIVIENCEKQALATSYKDNIYFEPQKKKAGIVCKDVNRSASVYNQIFCKLDSAKDSYLMNAQKQLKNIKLDDLPKEAKEYVEERLEKINNYISTEKGKNGVLVYDKDEISTIQPDIGRDKIAETVKTAEANRDVTIQSVEDGLQGMENQNQAVAYCPTY